MFRNKSNLMILAVVLIALLYFFLPEVDIQKEDIMENDSTIITGDIDSLPEEINGTISSFPEFPNLIYLHLSGEDINGDIASLPPMLPAEQYLLIYPGHYPIIYENVIKRHLDTILELIYSKNEKDIMRLIELTNKINHQINLWDTGKK